MVRYGGSPGHSPVLYINTNSSQVTTEEAAIRLLICQVTHGPPALVVHDDQRAALRGDARLLRLIDTDSDLGTVANRYLAVMLRNLLDGAREVTEMMLLAQHGSSMLAEGEEARFGGRLWQRSDP